MMQTIGHINVEGDVILVLIRSGKTYRSLKLRTSGKPGIELTDEGIYLTDDKDAFLKLVSGKVVNL